MPTIRLEQVSKIYKDQERNIVALSDINLEIRQGEFVFITGSRGAGKTTLLNLISGDLTPDSGAVFLDSVKISKKGRRLVKKLPGVFGKVPQEPSLNWMDTIQENFRPNKKLRSKWIDEPLAKKALGLVGMSGCENRYPVEFPMAEYRKIELAKAIMYSPRILILDEITERMDDDTIWDLMQLLNELNRRGTTILMSTHARTFVNIMRKRVITLMDGRIAGDVEKGRFGDIG